jgi:cell wall-associated NlpC family hydrolase
MMNSELIIKTAREYLGTPFHHQGRVKGVGIDCAGLVECVAREIGYAIPVHDGYGRQPFAGQMEAKLDEYLERSATLEPGCVLLMHFPGTPPMHVAIYAGDSIIHANEKVGFCVEHDYGDLWQKLTTRSYKWPRLHFPI